MSIHNGGAFRTGAHWRTRPRSFSILLANQCLLACPANSTSVGSGSHVNLSTAQASLRRNSSVGRRPTDMFTARLRTGGSARCATPPYPDRLAPWASSVVGLPNAAF